MLEGFLAQPIAKADFLEQFDRAGLQDPCADPSHTRHFGIRRVPM
jgi:hypothetical protein